MITQVELPTKQQLTPLVEQAIYDVGREVFFERNLHGIKDMLNADPLTYRHYGAYWWAIKDLLISNGLLSGESDEATTREHWKFDDPIYTLCAAWAYHQHQIESMVIQPHLHAYDVDGETYEYALEDLDMIAWEANRQG